MPESYKTIENRTPEACEAYHQRSKPKIAALARDFDVPYQRLRYRVYGQSVSI